MSERVFGSGALPAQVGAVDGANGYEPGHLKTAEGVMQVKLPQVRGLGERIVRGCGASCRGPAKR